MKIRTLLISGTILVLGLAQAAQAEQRCGWLENPTPGNYWLTDRDASWTIMAQGGYEAGGTDMIGDLSSGDYVATNGNYGHACACLDVTTDAENSQIITIHSFRQIAISRCTNDEALPAPGQ